MTGTAEGPLTVLREQLPLPLPYVAPRTETERLVAEIWRAAMGMDCVGVLDAYHDLGGDSFLAAVIFSQIELTFSIAIPLAILVESPTVAALAARLDSL